MRFASRFGKFGLQVQHEIREAYATGMSKVIQDQIAAYFEVGSLQPHERELAVGRWAFNGSYQEADEVTTVQPDYRIGVFDSVQAQQDAGWSDEMRRRVEQALVDHAARYDDVLVLPATSVPPPWPRYDDYSGSASALLRKVVDEGYDLNTVLAYERETKNRPEVTGGLEELLADPEKLAEMQPQGEMEEVMG